MLVVKHVINYEERSCSSPFIHLLKSTKSSHPVEEVESHRLYHRYYRQFGRRLHFTSIILDSHVYVVHTAVLSFRHHSLTAHIVFL